MVKGDKDKSRGRGGAIVCAHHHALSLSQDSKPKGRILLLPGGWCKAVSQGTPRMADALLNGTPNNAPPPIVTVVSKN